MPKKKPAAKKPAKKKIAPRRAHLRKIPGAALVPLSLVAAAARRPKPKAAAQSPVAAHAADWLPAAMPLRELMQTRLWPKQIKVGKRHRKEFGDLAALARDIDERGLLQPIVVDRSNHLIAGERRLRAWPLTKFAGEQIPVHIVPLKDIVSGEWAENDPALRRDFTLEEAVAIKHAIESRMKPAAAARARRKGEGDGRAGDKAAAFTGKSRRTLEKAEAIVAAAKAEPEKYGPLKDAMNKSGRADGPHKRLKTMQAAALIRSAPAPLPDTDPTAAPSSIFRGRPSRRMTIPRGWRAAITPIRPCRSRNAPILPATTSSRGCTPIASSRCGFRISIWRKATICRSSRRSAPTRSRS